MEAQPASATGLSCDCVVWQVLDQRPVASWPCDQLLPRLLSCNRGENMVNDEQLVGWITVVPRFSD